MVGQQVGQAEPGLGRVAAGHRGLCLDLAEVLATLLDPADSAPCAAPVYGFRGSITIQPRRRSSTASCSAGMRLSSCSWAE